MKTEIVPIAALLSAFFNFSLVCPSAGEEPDIRGVQQFLDGREFIVYFVNPQGLALTKNSDVIINAVSLDSQKLDISFLRDGSVVAELHGRIYIIPTSQILRIEILSE